MPRHDCHASLPPSDAVELLLRRAFRRALSGCIVTSVGLGSSGCLDDELPADASTPSDAQPEDDASTPPHDAGPIDSGPLIDSGTGRDAGVQPPDATVPGAPVTCPEGTWYPVQAAGLSTPESYDYLAIRRRKGDGQSDEEPGWTIPLSDVEVLSETGSACATANGEQCSEKVSQHEAPFVRTGCLQLCYELSVVSTRGDEVKRWAGQEELRALLGTVDSFDDALLLVSAADYDVACNDASRTTVREVEDGYIVYGTRITSDCAPVVTTRYELHVSRQGVITELSRHEHSREENLCIGRRPEGLRSQSVARGRSKIGDVLARSAHLEAASIFSFARLIRELEAHGAPAALVARAKRAREDEVRHAAQVGALARGHGGELVAIEVDAMHVRTLFEVALENAVEGCVRETYGALVGAYQAQAAEDVGVRAAMAGIADDEARHASLSHAVHAWISPQLSEAERADLRHAQVRAIFELALENDVDLDAEVQRALGLPSPDMARRLLRQLVQCLWRPQLQLHHEPRHASSAGRYTA